MLFLSGDEDIARIVETFDTFVDVDKYAAVVDLVTVKGNDCNLNISRYVDTAEAEEEIDIAAVIAEIREVKERAAGTETNLNNYLRELGFDEL